MTQKTNVHEKLTEKRCSNCNLLLAKASIKIGKVEIKCRCGTMNTFEAETLRTEGIVTDEELQKELMQHGISLKRAAMLIQRFR